MGEKISLFSQNEENFCPRKFLKDTVSVRHPAALFDFIRLRTRVLTMYIRCLGIKEVSKRLREINVPFAFRKRSLSCGLRGLRTPFDLPSYFIGLSR